MSIKLTEDQWESLIEYILEFLDFTSYENVKDKYSKLEYNRAVCKSGLEKLLVSRLICNLEEVTKEILKTDNILIPVNILEEILRGE